MSVKENPDKKKMLKKFLSDQINDTKNAIIFLLQVLIHHIFTFKLRLLYEMKQKVRLSKTVCVRFSIFESVLFLLIFLIFSTKFMDSLTLERHNFFQN